MCKELFRRYILLKGLACLGYGSTGFALGFMGLGFRVQVQDEGRFPKKSIIFVMLILGGAPAVDGTIPSTSWG